MRKPGGGDPRSRRRGAGLRREGGEDPALPRCSATAPSEAPRPERRSDGRRAATVTSSRSLCLGVSRRRCRLVAPHREAQSLAPPAAAADRASARPRPCRSCWPAPRPSSTAPQQSRSIVLFDEIVSRLETLRRQGSLPPRGREILAQAYELRGRAYYNIGLQEKAAESFRSLVQFQPQYVISREKVSPKVVDFFNSVKKALVGYLAVSTRPAGARVSLNGEFLSL